MKLARPLKVLLLALTMWMPLYIVFFMLILPMGISPESFYTLMYVHVATMLLQVALLVFYIVDVFKTPTLTNDRRTLWALAIFMGAPIAMPIYFAKHIWPDSYFPVIA